jgi:hypothetical protein
MNSTIPADLLELKDRFETWRTNRKYMREPIPDDLWNAAADLSRRYPPLLVGRVLKLDSSKLKKLLIKRSPPLRPLAIRIRHLAPHAHSSTANMPPDWRAPHTGCASASTNIHSRPRRSIDMSRSNFARSLPPTPHVRFYKRARSSSTTPRA